MLLVACTSSTECPEPRGYVAGRLENFVDVAGEACESTHPDLCERDVVDLDSRMTLRDIARRFDVDGEGVVEDACESRTVVAGVDGSRASGIATYEGGIAWSWTLRTDTQRGGCCYVGRMARNPARL
jgi:hypothetical protein